MAACTLVADAAMAWDGEWGIVALTSPGALLFGYAALVGQLPWWLEVLARTGPTHVDVEIMFLRPDEGGRAEPPAIRGYSPHFVVPPSRELLGVQFVDPENVQVGDGVTFKATARLLYRNAPYHLLASGSSFEIVEGGQVVGRGRALRFHRGGG